MRRLSTLVAVLVALLLAGATGALADPPSRLADRVTDRAGALDAAGRSEVTAAIDQLKSAKGTDLFVVFVRSFDGAGGQAWADKAATLSQLGSQDVLLAVATQDRAYGVSIADGFPLSESTTDAIITKDVEPRLSAGDWAGAAVTLADGLRTGGSAGQRQRHRHRRGRGRRHRRGGRRRVPAQPAAQEPGGCPRRRPRACAPGRSSPPSPPTTSATRPARPSSSRRRRAHLRAGAGGGPRPLRRRGGGRVRRGAGAVPRRHAARLHAAPAARRRRPRGRAHQALDARRDRPLLPGRRPAPRRPGRRVRPAAGPGGRRARVPRGPGHAAGRGDRARPAGRRGPRLAAHPLRRGGAGAGVGQPRPGPEAARRGGGRDPGRPGFPGRGTTHGRAAPRRPERRRRVRARRRGRHHPGRDPPRRDRTAGGRARRGRREDRRRPCRDRAGPGRGPLAAGRGRPERSGRAGRPRQAALASAAEAERATPPDPWRRCAWSTRRTMRWTAASSTPATPRPAARRPRPRWSRRCSPRARPSRRRTTSSSTRRGAVGTDARTRLAEAQRHLAAGAVRRRPVGRAR